MTQGGAVPGMELDDILGRLEAARAALMEAIDGCDPARFADENDDGDSVKRTLERAVDEVNFYYGTLVARALNLPQPPCMTNADFMSLREGSMSLQVAHRRFGNLLHDVLPEDLDKTAADDHATYTLRQVLEMAVAHYARRAQQLMALAPKKPRRRPRQTSSG
jgi:hypothetical protein